MKAKLVYTVRSTRAPGETRDTIVPVIVDRLNPTELETVVENCIDRGLIAGLKSSAAKSIADGTMIQLGKTLNGGTGVIFGEFFAVRPYLTGTIEMLADVMIQREKTWKEFEESGGTTMIPYTNKNGSTNLVKNPVLIMWNELTKTALAYRRELGLTPAGIKKLNEQALQEKKRSPLAAALTDFG